MKANIKQRAKDLQLQAVKKTIDGILTILIRVYEQNEKFKEMNPKAFLEYIINTDYKEFNKITYKER